ncbi:MarR family winged helix-turn-helix transcriptional regulator [Salsuginibacillus kocurii]|uniref:MarR family winged helix-turn-helix transcriptional regulator n=1 Tax=Salsuginibacillus kocurii TaxID=427078 RepID=UPI00036AAD89|nr:MarR family transcriptional regulator [Salsuginibacillus kocurii]
MNEHRALKLWVVWSRAHSVVVDRLKADVRDSKLNFTEFAVLELLEHKGPQPIQHISEQILIASGSITYVVDKLEKKGLLSRNPCPNDRRIIYADITSTGSELMQAIFPKHQREIESIFEVLSEKEQEEMIRMLKKIGFENE